jgi:hypothetical protein
MIGTAAKGERRKMYVIVSHRRVCKDQVRQLDEPFFTSSSDGSALDASTTAKPCVEMKEPAMEGGTLEAYSESICAQGVVILCMMGALLLH